MSKKSGGGFSHLQNTFFNFKGNTNGIQGIRMYTPCASGTSCDLFESPSRVRLTSARWYPSVARLDDGSIIIFSGSTVGGCDSAIYARCEFNLNLIFFSGLSTVRPLPTPRLNFSRQRISTVTTVYKSPARCVPISHAPAPMINFS
jgi:hypothetical protein